MGRYTIAMGKGQVCLWVYVPLNVRCNDEVHLCIAREGAILHGKGASA